MKQRYLSVILVLFTILSMHSLQAQTQLYDLVVVVTRNDQTAQGVFEIKVQIQSDGAVPFAMGTSNLVFTYNSSGLTGPTLQAPHNFSGGNYTTMAITEPVTGRVSINIELTNTNNGTTVLSSLMDVVTIRFTITDPAEFSGIVWNTAPPNRTNVFDHDNLTEVTADDLNGLDTALPVELVSFSANVDNGRVMLSWVTASETNNFGFDIERSEDEIEFQKVGFVEGKGTTILPQQYVFVDEKLAPGTYYYRLKQVDLDGVFEYTNVINITLTPPKEFALAQNYPNPFNPETTIKYDLPVSSHVVLKIFNILGEEVKTLVDAEQTAGINTIIWNGKDKLGKDVSSGAYIYQMQAGGFTKVKKLTLLR